MILAAGLTPAWQQILVFDEWTRGEVNRVRQTHTCASGKVINVAAALRQLGADSKLLTLVGGLFGAAMRTDLDRRGIAHHLMESQTPTRVCTTLLTPTGPATELVENAAGLPHAELDDFLILFESEARSARYVVLSGSLPAGTSTEYYRDLLVRTTADVILDARGPELLAALPCQPYLVKPNRKELAQTLGAPIKTDGDLLNAVRRLRQLGARHVLITNGAGAVWLDGESGSFWFSTLPVDAVNTIGCGDCMAAAIAWSLARGEDLPAAVCTGIAAAADNARKLLPADLDPDWIGGMISRVSIQEKS